MARRTADIMILASMFSSCSSTQCIWPTRTSKICFSTLALNIARLPHISAQNLVRSSQNIRSQKRQNGRPRTRTVSASVSNNKSQLIKCIKNSNLIRFNGGETGIRTLETVSRPSVFKTGAIDHSAKPPHWRCRKTGRPILQSDNFHADERGKLPI